MKKNVNLSLKPVGFWREHCGDIFPSIFDAKIKKLEICEIEKIEGYLVKCPICVASPGIVYSAFDEDKIAGISSIKTDGSWVWPDTLQYYVREHGIALPLEFLEHIRYRHYIPLEEHEVNVEELIFPLVA